MPGQTKPVASAAQAPLDSPTRPYPQSILSMAKPDKKTGRKVRVAFRRNQSTPARPKDWKRNLDDDPDLPESPTSESVVAKGDLSRYRTIIEEDDQHAPSIGTQGRVVAVRGLIAEVDDGQHIWPCTLRRVLRTRRIQDHHPITVGDIVRFTTESSKQSTVSEGVIEWVAPRRGQLKRRVGRSDRVVVANVDRVLIVSSADLPPPKPHLIDRYLVASHAGGIEPVICVNKMDLDEQGAGADALAVYKSLGYVVVGVSVVTGQGIDELREILRDRESVVAGQSGVGKSSLLNAVQPGLRLRVGDIIEQISKGRHTTTTARLLPLDVGGYVVDTPGIRAFDITSVPLAEIEAYFIEFAEHLAHCKYADCTHIHEPHCAVQAAVEANQITPARYQSYAKMFKERAG